MRKNAFTMVELIAIVVIMASILLIVLPSITGTIKNSEEKKKQESLNNIYMATENYLMANYEDYKIDNAGDTTYVYITDLINNNYMSVDIVNPNNDSSFSNRDVVKITRNDDGTFSYELDYLKTLIETLLEQYNPSNTTGLLKDSTNENLYYYKGTNEEVANNFLWYGGHQWRIIEFDTSTKTLTLITQQPITAIQSASIVWDTEEEYNSSYINTWLNEYFWNSLDSSIQANILDNTFNIGIYGETPEEQNVNEITTVKKVGLLDAEQYLKAGSADSFLNIKDHFLLVNRYNSSNVRRVNNVGNFSYNSPSVAIGVRAVIKISDITITGGDGTLSNSYQVGNKVTNTNNIQVGEYINVPYSGSDNACGSDNMCTFRVVSKDSDSIKVVLNGLLPSISAWGDNASDDISISDTIYINVLNIFVENIDSKYLTKGTYGIGMYTSGDNYTVLQSKTLTSDIGLPAIGEMFSGNDIDLSTSNSKTFVDINTIENSTTNSYYWTMNRYSSSNVHYIIYSGSLYYNIPSLEIGVRPVIYLKNNLTFTGGNGTAQNPYTLD